MPLSTQNRALLRGLLAGAVVLASASACSRADRADRGRDSTSVGQTAVAVQPDTQRAAASQGQVSDTIAPAASDTGAKTPSLSTKKAWTKPSNRIKPSDRPNLARDSAAQNGDQGVAGYRAMGHDSSASAVNDSSTAAAADTSAAISVAVSATTSADTAAADTSANGSAQVATQNAGVPDTTGKLAAKDSTSAEYPQTAQDTSETVAQIDTAAQANGDVAIQAQADTSAQAQPDTSAQAQANVAVQNGPDTAVAVGDSAAAGKTEQRIHPTVASADANADTLSSESKSDRVRLGEDSTETLGNVTTDSAKDDVEAAGDATGAARVSEMATGADAVALMSRQGLRCIVVESDSNKRQWDMASTPVTLNPCGLGTMQLSRIWTGEEK